MFSTSKSMDPAHSDSSHTANVTVIARGVRVEGEFVSQGNVLIEGEVSGHLKIGGVLTIGHEAKLKADVTAEEASIAGVIEGNVTIKKRLELKSTAKLFGDLTCETATIEAGAVMSGKVMIGSAPKPATSSTPVKSQTSPAKEAT